MGVQLVGNKYIFLAGNKYIFLASNKYIFLVGNKYIFLHVPNRLHISTMSTPYTMVLYSTHFHDRDINKWHNIFTVL